MNDVLRQKVEELDGSRRQGGQGRAAVRIEDMDGLLQLSPLLQSAKAAGTAVTVSEFNKLIEDVHAMHRRLAALVTQLRARRGR